MRHGPAHRHRPAARAKTRAQIGARTARIGTVNDDRHGRHDRRGITAPPSNEPTGPHGTIGHLRSDTTTPHHYGHFLANAIPSPFNDRDSFHKSVDHD